MNNKMFKTKFLSVTLMAVMVMSMLMGVTAQAATYVPTGALTVSGFELRSADNSAVITEVTEGNSCSIKVFITDTRTNGALMPVTPTTGDMAGINKRIKVVSSSSSFSNTFGSIDAYQRTGDTISYAIIFKGISYKGGTPDFSFNISYFSDDNQSPCDVPMSTQTITIGQAIDLPDPTPPAPAPDPVPDAKKKIVPKTIKASAPEIFAGSEFTVTAVAFNASDVSNIENVAVSLGTLPEGVMLVSGSANQFIGTLSPQQNITTSFKLLAKGSIVAGSYKITLQYTSTDEGVSATQDITVTIKQPERFEISRVEYSDILPAGEENPCTVYLLNQGKSIIYNVSAEISGDNLSNPGQKQYIGNIAAGTEDSADFSIAAPAGALNCTVTITYENDNGEIKTLTKDFSATVEDMSGGMDMGGMGFDDPAMVPMEEPKPGIPWWVWVLIALAVLGAGAGALFTIKKIKAKKSLVEDDDEDI